MKLLIITQKVDENDQLLGFFIGWLSEFSKYFEVVNILCLEKGAYSLPSNVKVFSLGKDRGEGKIVQLFNFYKHIVTLDYDSVFVHMNPIWMVLGGICWRIMGKKAALWYTHKAVTLRLRLALIFSKVVFTASSESFRIRSRKIVVTGHGIDANLFKPSYTKRHRDGTLRILSVGRISPVKNYEILIGAAKILRDEAVDFKITIIGEPTSTIDVAYISRLKKSIDGFSLNDRFTFLGKINNKYLPEYYQTNDLFVHLSKTGSLDKTTLEAIACGMNVVSSNDAMRAVLPADNLFRQDDVVDLARLIIREGRANKNFVSLVVEHHNINKLIAKISHIIYGHQLR